MRATQCHTAGDLGIGRERALDRAGQLSELVIVNRANGATATACQPLASNESIGRESRC
jgi:hypothetical protein